MVFVAIATHGLLYMSNVAIYSAHGVQPNVQEVMGDDEVLECSYISIGMFVFLPLTSSIPTYLQTSWRILWSHMQSSVHKFYITPALSKILYPTS